MCSSDLSQLQQTEARCKELETERDSAASQLQQTEARCKELETERDSAASQLQQREAQLAERQRELATEQERLVTSAKQLTSAKDQVENENAGLQESLDRLVQEHTRVMQENEDQTRKVVELNEELELQCQWLNDTKSELEAVTSQVRQLTIDNASLTEAAEASSRLAESRGVDQDKLKSDLTILRAEVDNLGEVNDSLRAKCDDYDDIVSQLSLANQLSSQLQSERDSLEQERSKLEEEVQQLTDDVSARSLSHEQEVRELRLTSSQREAESERERSSLQTELQGLRAHNHELQVRQ